MIARVWHGAVSKGNGDAYLSYLQATGEAEIRGTPGNRGVQILRRDSADRTDFLFISYWESFEAIRRFAGEAVEVARYYPKDREFLLELEPSVTHYEVFGGDAPLP
jgi:heme-degrading monooxygenase HmoA